MMQETSTAPTLSALRLQDVLSKPIETACRFQRCRMCCKIQCKRHVAENIGHTDVFGTSSAGCAVKNNRNCMWVSVRWHVGANNSSSHGSIHNSGKSNGRNGSNNDRSGKNNNNINFSSKQQQPLLQQRLQQPQQHRLRDEPMPQALRVRETP